MQSTNDSSIQSKLSMVRNGYMEDDFIAYFSPKNARRSPLINRGYFVRARSIGLVLEAFCSRMKSKSCQVLSLGAGFDTSFFRLKALEVLPERCHYYEVDFPLVVKRKCEIVASTPQLSALVGVPTGHNSWANYRVIAQDLADINSLQAALVDSGINFELPTLVLAECVLSYLDVRESDAVITWTARAFSNCVLVVYEQIYPSDGFGIVMLDHFAKLGSPLKSLHEYPDPPSLQRRYLSHGYEKCTCVGMNDFFAWLDDGERKRIRSLEPFDEFEEWHEKCNHYVLALATKGQDFISPYIPLPVNRQTQSEPVRKRCVWKLEEAPRSLWRLAHTSVIVSAKSVLTLYGFADDGGKHRRVFSAVVTDLDTNATRRIEVGGQESAFDGRQHAAAAGFSDGSVLVNGGRASPLGACRDDLLLLPDETKPRCYAARYVKLAESPKPRWRHTLHATMSRGNEVAILFGGRTAEDAALDDCFVYFVARKRWSEVPRSGGTPSKRHSHAVVTAYGTKMLVTCGLGEDEAPLNSIHSFDTDRYSWEEVYVAGVRGRYGHTAHFVPPDVVLLVGGAGTYRAPPCGIAVVNLSSRRCVEVAFPNQSPERPVVVFNHTSVIYDGAVAIFGGGGNCFSFGTHFNKCVVKVDVESCLAHLEERSNDP